MSISTNSSKVACSLTDKVLDERVEPVWQVP